jgi:hypothetical protein
LCEDGVGGGREGYHCSFGIGIENIEVGPLKPIELFLVRQSNAYSDPTLLITGLVEFGFQAEAFAL